jgi:hypothetical protein
MAHSDVSTIHRYSTRLLQTVSASERGKRGSRNTRCDFIKILAHELQPLQLTVIYLVRVVKSMDKDLLEQFRTQSREFRHEESESEKTKRGNLALSLLLHSTNSAESETTSKELRLAPTVALQLDSLSSDAVHSTVQTLLRTRSIAPWWASQETQLHYRNMHTAQ